jgi:molybdate transport system ATP-binding protein
MLSGEIDAHFGQFRLHSRIELVGGGVHAVFGPSGCGKSLLLRWLAGLIQPRAARLRLGDEVWQDGRRGLPPHRRSLGYVAQQPALFPHLSVRENLEYGYRRSRAPRIDPDAVIAALGLAALFGQTVHSLSGGQRQRLAIGRALLCSPRLLLLDEPLSALDRPAKLGILRDLRRLQIDLDVPMLFVSHAAEEVERLADQVLLMQAGVLRPAQPLQAMAMDAGLDPEAGPINLIEVEPISYDTADALVELACADLRLWLPAAAALPRRARLRIAARDVGLSRDAPHELSFQNRLPVRVERIVDSGPGRSLVHCRSAAGLPLCAELTRRACRQLDLGEGQGVHLLLKSAALLD